MFSLLKRYRELIIVGALLLYPFGKLLTGGQAPRDPNFLDRFIIATSSLLERVVGFGVDGVRNAFNGYVDLRGTRAANVQLVAENGELRRKVQALTEAGLENERFRSLLAYTEETLGTEVTGRVIGVNPVANLLSVRLDRGEKHGVVKGTAVISTDGIVGQVIRVTPGYCDVLLVTDPNSRTAVRVQRTRARGTAVGGGAEKNLQLENLSRSDEAAEADVIITAGTDGVFPPGLMVGTARSVQRKHTGMFQRADIVLAVDIARLEEVLVLPPVSQGLNLDANGTLPAGAKL